MKMIKFQRKGQPAKYIPNAVNYKGYLVGEYERGIGTPVTKGGFNEHGEGEVWEEYEKYEPAYRPYFDTDKMTEAEKELIKSKNYQEIQDVLTDRLEHTLIRFETNDRYSISDPEEEKRIKAANRPAIEELFILSAGEILNSVNNKMLHSLGAEIGNTIKIWTTIYAKNIPNAKTTLQLKEVAEKFGFTLDKGVYLVAPYSEQQKEDLISFLKKYDVKIWPDSLGMERCWECGSYFKPKKDNYDGFNYYCDC